MASLFISYSRKDIESAQRLTEALKTQDLDFWIDWEGIEPALEWRQEIQKGIEEADNFLFLISPDSIQSNVCGWEVEQAIKNGKRLIPVVVRDVRAADVPSELRSLNWIFLRESDDFKIGIGKLLKAIKTDYDWVEAHRRLQVKALEWERRDHEGSFLLRGRDLENAESLLVTHASSEPHPTDLQREFVLKSRQASERQRRITTAISVAGIIILAAFAAYAGFQAINARNAEATAVSNASIAETERANAIQESNGRATAQANAEANQKLAEERARIALAGELAAQSSVNDEPLLSLLLSVESLKYLDGRAQRNSLLSGLQSVPGLNTILSGFPASVWSLAFSPDGNTLAAGTTNGTITLWDASDPGDPVLLGDPLDSHSNDVWSVAFGPDGKMLAAGTVDHTIVLWDISDRTAPVQLGEPLTGHTDDVNSVAFSPVGRLMASAGCAQPTEDGCSQGEILFWDVSDRHAPALIGKPLDAHQQDIQTVAFSPDGRILASGSWDNTILLWDVSDPASPTAIAGPLTGHTLPVFSVAFSPDGKMLASGSMDNTIRLWDLSNPAHPMPLGEPIADHTEAVWSVAFSSNGKTLASGSTDHTVILRDISDPLAPQPLGPPLAGHSNIVLSVAFRPDGKSLASGGVDRTVILWDVPGVLVSPLQVGEPLQHSGYVWDETFSPDGKVLASAASDGTITLWDVSDPRSTRQIGEPHPGHSHMAESVSFSPDGRTLASSGCGKDDGENCTEGEVILWDASRVAAPRMISKFSGGHRDDVQNAVFSPDGKTLALGSWDKTISLWDISDLAHPVQTGDPLQGHEGRIFTIAFSPDGRMLASSGDDFFIMLWDVSNPGVRLSVLPVKHTGYIWSIAFSPNGRILASSSLDNTVILWDVSDPENPFQLGEPLSHEEDVTSVAFSPDGKMLATTDCAVSAEDGSCRLGEVLLWDVSNLTAVLPLGQPLLGHRNQISSLVFSPDSKTLASGSFDTTVRLWDVDPHSWAALACQKAGRNFTQQEWKQFIPIEAYQATCPQWPLEQASP